MSPANNQGGVPKLKKGGGYAPIKQSNTLPYVLGGIVIVVIIAVIAVVLVTHRSSTPKPPTAADKTAAVAQLASTASFTAGSPTAKVTVDIFSDFQCPYCAEFEQQSGPQIVQAIDAGTLQVRYHVVNFLDQNSASGTYSSRAAGAALSIAKSSLPAAQKQKVWLAYYQTLYAQQPKEKGDGGTSDYSNADLARIAGQAAKTAGVTLPAEVTKAISDGTNVAAASTAGQSGMTLLETLGGQGTPTVIHDGAPVDALGNPGWLNTLLAG
ncbi:hypothetical protein GCM10023147_47100 [Tsukamurella soli]|uniref:Thioredoxin-like fold domain-containing protein n=1 Tax=Tsukamurella soli TaxID=644556 RepID=A0ABP8KE81_9ACTN